MTDISQLARGVIDGAPIDRTGALELLRLSGDRLYELFYWANQIRQVCFGRQIELCSIASIRTGRCSEDCRFCAQSSHYITAISNYIADDEQLVGAARIAMENGVDHFGLVSSGQKLSDNDIDRLAKVVQTIKGSADLTCCASLGCLTESQAKRLYDAGFRRYNHNLETSEHYFGQVVTTHLWSDRVATVQAAKKARLKVCCGGIIGMGESLEDRVDLALALRELDVDAVPMNFLNPIPGTPFEHIDPLPPLEALQTVAMFRFVLPNKPIKIAGGRQQCLRDLQSWMFFAGASGMMVGNYLTTQGRPVDQDLQMLGDLGLSKKP